MALHLVPPCPDESFSDFPRTAGTERGYGYLHLRIKQSPSHQRGFFSSDRGPSLGEVSQEPAPVRDTVPAFSAIPFKKGIKTGLESLAVSRSPWKIGIRPSHRFRQLQRWNCGIANEVVHSAHFRLGDAA